VEEEVIREDHIEELNQLDDAPDNDLPLELAEEMLESKIEKFLNNIVFHLMK
jgi:hypothetical protein